MKDLYDFINSVYTMFRIIKLFYNYKIHWYNIRNKLIS